MSTTLKEALQQRRMAESQPVRSYELAKEPVRSLQIHSSNGGKLVLPWSHFHSACHQGIGEDEQLALLFAKHEIVLRGVRLTLLLPKIAGFHLACVWGEPVEFQVESDKNAAFVSRVSVRCLTESIGRIP
jgi:hypothetical protein